MPNKLVDIDLSDKYSNGVYVIQVFANGSFDLPALWEEASDPTLRNLVKFRALQIAHSNGAHYAPGALQCESWPEYVMRFVVE